MATDVQQEQLNSDTVDHLISTMSGAVIYIVDLWEGSKTDPATEIKRYIGLWRDEQLENEQGEAFDPDFTDTQIVHRYSGGSYIKPEPVVWELIETIKTADRGALDFKSQQDHLLQGKHSTYNYTAGKESQLYIAFIAAIDVLAEDPENEEAWAAVQAWRDYRAGLHEK